MPDRMMHGMTPVPPGATPERLTASLRRAGVLADGAVVDVAVETPRDTLISRVARLRLTYSGPAPGAPSHVFLKEPRDGAEPAWQEFGRKETTFYEVVGAATPGGLLPRCYDAVVEPTGRWGVLLEDLTDSHEMMADWPLPPSIERCHAIVGAHARFHAAWWDD